MKPNYSGVTTARTPTENRSEWTRRDQARKREIAHAKDTKRTANLIISAMASEIAELRKRKPMIVKLEPWEAWLILSKGGMVWAAIGRKRERCWLTREKEIYIGNIPARLAAGAEFETEIYFTEE